jgi:hypothetical protein
MRHRRLELLCPHDDAHAAGEQGEVGRRLPGRVAAAHDDDILAAAALGIPGHDRVVHAGAAEALDAVGLELTPLGSGRHHHRAGEHVLPVVEVDAHEALRAIGQLHRAMEAREHRVEAARLERRVARQLRAGDAGREAEVVLDARARAGLSAGSPGLCHERAQALGAAVDRSRETRGAGAEHDEIEAPAVDLRAQAERARHLCRRRIAQHLGRMHEDGRLGARDVEPVEQRGALLVGIHVVPAHRQQVALEQIAHLEGAA